MYYHLDPEIMAFHGLVNSGSVWRLVPVTRQVYYNRFKCIFDDSEVSELDPK